MRGGTRSRRIRPAEGARPTSPDPAPAPPLPPHVPPGVGHSLRENQHRRAHQNR